MNFIERDSRSNLPSSSHPEAGIGDVNYFAFFDKPTPENLAFNHSGILAPQQQKALESRIAYQRNVALTSAGMSVLAILFLCFLFWKIDSSDGAVSISGQMINAVLAVLIFGTFMGFVVGDFVLFFAGDDVTNGVVESSVGKIVWGGRRYEMQTDTRVLRSLRFSGVASPPPGTYRFYYLPRTGLVVMAEEVPKNVVHGGDTLLQALANANRFSLEDLKINQEGHLSKHQENRLLLTAILYLAGCVSSAAFFGVFIPQIRSAVSETGLVFALSIGSVLLLRFGWSTANLIADLWQGRVEMVQGPVAVQHRRTKYSISYYYVCDAHRFQVSSSAYRALLEQPAYRIYYVPHSKKLVSIEPIHPAS